MKEFYVQLPSNASVGLFPDNRGTNYKVQLPRYLEFGTSWMVGLAEILFPRPLFKRTRQPQIFEKPSDSDVQKAVAELDAWISQSESNRSIAERILNKYGGAAAGPLEFHKAWKEIQKDNVASSALRVLNLIYKPDQEQKEGEGEE